MFYTVWGVPLWYQFFFVLAQLCMLHSLLYFNSIMHCTMMYYFVYCGYFGISVIFVFCNSGILQFVVFCILLSGYVVLWYLGICCISVFCAFCMLHLGMFGYYTVLLLYCYCTLTVCMLYYYCITAVPLPYYYCVILYCIVLIL